MQLPNLKTYAAVSLVVSAVALSGCGGSSSSKDDDNTNPGGTADSVAEFMELKGDFNEDVTLNASNVYKITGEVNFLDGTTLTIPAGTTLYGSTGSSYLAINRGAQIIADGTADNPIIFTSAQDIAGTANQNDQGQWGGLTILGKSTNNKGERTYEAGTQLYGPVEGVTTADDNSGVLDYVIIKYSGYEVEVDKELNGLSLGSVGSGTQISNIAVIGSADDGIEFWGGTVDVENIYIYNAGDDSLDTDQGYTGTMTNVYVQQVVVDDETGSRGIEADSYNETRAFDPSAPADQQVISKPVLVDATLDTIGRAVRLREGTGYVFDNVQINVKSSSVVAIDDDEPADGIVDVGPGSTYYETIAAIRVSETAFTGNEIEVAAGGLAIKNDAVDLIANDTDTGDIGSDGIVTNGKGMYRNTDTLNIFRALSNLHETVGVSGDMVDEGFLDSDGNAFTVEVSAYNTVTGADLTVFDWVIEEVNDRPVVFLQGDITSNMALDASNLYAINGEVNVTGDGTTLTIPAGTTLFGVTGSSYLAINRGADIVANGTATAPIVFTSAQDIAGLNTGDEQGQWGGLTILGGASANKGERTYEAGTQLYGPDGTATPGTDCPATTAAANCGYDSESSGTLRYVVVKYSGYEVEKDKELNGISLAAVGSGTVIENVGSIGSADDGIELWGGTVSIDGLYVYNAGDDSIDTDQGYRGAISNVLAVQNVVDSETGSRVIEADSHSTDETGVPQSRVAMSNAILRSVGRAVRLREGTDYDFNNVVITVESGSAGIEAFRMSDTAAEPTGAATTFSVSGNGLEIINNVTATDIFHSEAQTFVDSNMISLSNGLTVTEYDSSWTE